MVTSGAAIATNWQNEVGTLEAGKAADLVVVDNIHANPYRNLINAIDPDVRLTVVGGLAVYGDQDIMTALKGADTEPAGKFGKAVDVTFLAAPEGAQTWSSIVENLTMAMRFDVEEMTAAFGDANDFDSVTRNMPNVGLDPWYTYGDQRYFNVLNGSGTANFQIEMSKLYDRYYDRDESLPPVLAFEVVEETAPEPCDDGTQPPCTEVTDPNDSGGENNSPDTSDNTTVVPDEVENNPGQVTTPVDLTQAEEDDVAGQALLLLVVLVALMLVALYFVSRGGEDALAAEVEIEKLWDEQEAAAAQSETAFVPSLPPLSPPDEAER